VKREDKFFRSVDPENRRSSGGTRSASRSKQAGYVGQASASGRSGYGSESVRPYLRAQLKLKELLATPFPPPDEDKPKRKKGW
jgi:hypothetical protein